MANKMTSEESPASALTGPEEIPGVQSGADVKITPDQISTFVLGKAELAELIRDTIAAALTAGANVTITPNDGSNTITIASSGGGGGGGTPGGDDQQVQINDDGAFGGSSLYWDQTNIALQFGGQTSAFPMLKRDGPNLDLRKADSSGRVGMNMNSLTIDQYLSFDDQAAIYSRGYNGSVFMRIHNAAQLTWTAATSGAAGDAGIGRAGVGRMKITDASAGVGELLLKLPTSDPAIAGVLWNNSGTITISAG